MNRKQNSYSLSSESRRWWWPSATAGGVGVAAIAAIVVLPTTGHAIPVDDTGPAPDLGGTVFLEETTGPTHPCFMIRARWNEALDYEQPTCGGSTTTGRPEHHGVVRPWLDY